MNNLPSPFQRERMGRQLTPEKYGIKPMKASRRGKVALVLAGIGLAGTTALVAHEIADNVKGPSFEEKVESTVEANPTILNAKVILSEGVKLRSSPTMENPDQSDPGSNVLREVNDGEALVLDHPLVYENHVNHTYLGFTDKEGNYAWVNETLLLDAQKGTGEHYITILDDENNDAEQQAGNYTDGHFYQGANQEILAATATEIPESYVDQVLPYHK